MATNLVATDEGHRIFPGIHKGLSGPRRFSESTEPTPNRWQTNGQQRMETNSR